MGVNIENRMKGDFNMDTRKLKLCGKCAALLKANHELKKVGVQVNMKVTCDKCGRRRYGAVYQMGSERGETT